MDILPFFCSLLLVSGSCEAFPFLWPSSFRSSSKVGATTTTTTTTTHNAGPPHPHAQNMHSVTTGSGGPSIPGQPHSSHLHVRPTSVGSYLASRPLPPLVGAHHHHHQNRPVSGPNSHLHVQGGTIAGSHSTGHRHHYHLHQPQNQPHHHHHHHHAARVLHHVHPAALHFPLHA